MPKNPLAALRQRLRRWWQARLPATDTLALTQRNVYILPTGSGWMLALTLLVLLIASINFQLNLGYLLTFLLAGEDRRDMVDTLLPLLSLDELEALQRTVLAVHASDALLAYVQDLIAATRSGRWFVQGLSPRAGIALVRAAKARALIEGRDYVAPDDVQAVLPQTIAHRLVPVGDAGRGALEQVRAMVEATPLP